MEFKDFILQSENYNKIREFCKKKGSLSINGATLSCYAAIISNIARENNQKYIYIANNSLRAGKITEDLLLDPYEYMLYDVETKSTDLSAKRVEILYKLLSNSWNILVTTPSAMAQWLPNPEFIKNSAIKIRVGGIIEIDELSKKLISSRYIKVPEIDGKGQFAVRGDIVDIFPYGAQNPVRAEFFDNEIDSLRNFDLLSQRTTENTSEVTILPDNETYIWNWEHRNYTKELMKI